MHPGEPTLTSFDIFDSGWSTRTISADLDRFDEAIDFIVRNGCDGLQLRSPATTDEVVPDFRRFEEVSDLLIHLSIDSSGKLKRARDPDGIYALSRLQKLVLAKERLEIDVSRFGELREMGIEYSPGISGLAGCAALQTLVLRKYPKSDLAELSPLGRLSRLHVYQSKITSVDGIEGLGELEEVALSYNSGLSDVHGIPRSAKVRKLHLERCERLAAFRFDENSTVRELFITSIASAGNVERLSALELITFWNLLDGDLAAFLTLPSLKEIRFHPQKKHYSHAEEEINRLLRAR